MRIVMVSGSRNRERRTARSIMAIGKGAAKAGAWWNTFFCRNSISKGAASATPTAPGCV